ncbi:hypothetical protein [Nocardia sp. CC227C]|uniref:hypothetical protein n=1 Tax=Nocardia sp. CC227C TaxID=3044562 RepID=UPI00278BE54F|nr:hypothetical protein [Nocardia sp. CC227C]
MTIPIAHPAVTVAIALLEAKLPLVTANPIFVSGAFEDGHDRLVRVDRMHTGMVNMVTDEPFMLFECWVADRPGVYNGSTEAEILANQVRAVLTAARSETFAGCFVRYWHDAGCSPHPDPKRPSMVRWQVIGSLGLAVSR